MVDLGFAQVYESNSSAVNDCLEAALTDRFILGMQTGMRKSELCHDRHIIRIAGAVLTNRDGSPSTFTLHTFTFEKHYGIHCNNSRSNNIIDATIVK